jgi:hypothetical protein
LAAQRSGDSVALRGFVDSAHDAFFARVDLFQLALVAAVPVYDALPGHLSSTGGRKCSHAYLEHTPENVEVRLQLAWTLREEGESLVSRSGKESPSVASVLEKSYPAGPAVPGHVRLLCSPSVMVLPQCC